MKNIDEDKLKIILTNFLLCYIFGLKDGQNSFKTNYYNKKINGDEYEFIF